MDLEVNYKLDTTVYKQQIIYSKCSLGVTPRGIDDSSCIGCCHECDSKGNVELLRGRIIEIIIRHSGIYVKVNWDNYYNNSEYIVGEDVLLMQTDAEHSIIKM